jgi:hypothetical protein
MRLLETNNMEGGLMRSGDQMTVEAHIGHHVNVEVNITIRTTNPQPVRPSPMVGELGRFGTAR